MLWRQIRRTTALTGVNLVVTHGLNIPPNAWRIESVSDKALGRTRVVPGTVLTNTIAVVNNAQSVTTVDVFVMSLRNELF